MGTAVTPFGITKTGAQVDAVHLSGFGLHATILTYGAILQDVRLDGIAHGLTLGSDRLRDYEDRMIYHGAIIGPVANRLSGAVVTIDGVAHPLEANLNGQHMLHGGSSGTHKKIWNIDNISRKSVTFSTYLQNGEAGFPGNRTITARYDIIEGPAMRLTLTTISDAPSVANATNHSYWNLDGTDHMRDHVLRIAAPRYLPTNASAIPTGQVATVTGTAFDFTAGKHLVPGAPPLDTTFCVANGQRPLTECAWLHGASGITLAVSTTEAGVHVFDASVARRPGCPYYEGIAIEAQGWPDAPRHAHFPTVAIMPDRPVTQMTRWCFARNHT